MIPLTGERTLRVLGVRDDDADQPPALIVEDLPGPATSAAGWDLRASEGSGGIAVASDPARRRVGCDR